MIRLSSPCGQAAAFSKAGSASVEHHTGAQYQCLPHLLQLSRRGIGHSHIVRAYPNSGIDLLQLDGKSKADLLQMTC